MKEAVEYTTTVANIGIICRDLCCMCVCCAFQCVCVCVHSCGDGALGKRAPIASNDFGFARTVVYYNQ